MATFSYTLPTVGGSEDTWGTALNANWTALGAFLGSLDSTELAVLDGLTSTTAELNLLSGATLTTAELNLLTGATVTTDELNLLDGVTATTAEINLLDGDTAATATTLVDADRLVANDDGTMVQVAMTDVGTYTSAAAFTALSLDEDDMASDSDTKLPTQQSVKAYVDTAIAAITSLGVGQTWQTVADGDITRSGNTAYQNTTGRPIQVNVSTEAGDNFQISTDGSSWKTISTGITGGDKAPHNVIVPDQLYYRVDGTNLTGWAELR